MKRLFFVICALTLILSSNVAFAAAPGTAKAPVGGIDADSFIGMAAADLTAKYGTPARMEPSEYGFKWYIYNSDYKNFFMAGVQDDKVVAFYTNAETQNYKKQFSFGSAKAAVRAKLGKPIGYIRLGNTICVLNNTDQKDIYPVDSNYVMVFYDNIIGGKVTSIMVVPQDAEADALINHPALSSDLEEAYARISVDLINAVRVRSGLRKLTIDVLDTKLAVSRSKDMRDRNYFSHYTPAPENLSPFDQARRMGIKYTSMGENIAFGDHNAIIAHEAFMNSAGHRSNILKAVYSKIGAGVAYGGSRYVLLTNEFTN